MFCLRKFTVFICCATFLMVQSSHGSEVIGGEEVKPHSLPFMALLENNGSYCGGILVSPSWVLTAAHCGKIQKVLLGVHAINAAENQSRQIRTVRKGFPHPNYNKIGKDNDLMLLKLDKPVKETKTVTCLPLGNSAKDRAAGTRCMVAGWGQTSDQKKLSNVLMAAIVTVVSRKKCNSYYDIHITSGMICAGSDGKKFTDTARGDSGGPLLCSGVLVGVTSFGKKPVTKYPGVYTFLSKKQLFWMKKTMTN